MLNDEVIGRGGDEENSLIPLVTFDEDRINFRETVARETFANERFRGVKITFVSVMGPSRSGKSFLMSVLTNGVNGNKIHGAFQSGLQRFTEGILIFTRPIFIDKTHAVFFLDTQGTFDMQTERKISAWIAGFSLLFSDIQIVNLMGNLGGNDLHDIHMFAETTAAFRDGKLAESLIFVIRDTPDWDQEESFLERVWAQNENSSDLREISSSLRRHFPKIECFCTPRASDNVRFASEYLEIQEHDFPLLSCLARIKYSVIEKCKNLQGGEEIEEKIELAQKIVNYLQYEAPELKTTTVLSKEASVAVAVNKCSEIFRKALKNTSPETLQIAETMARKEIDQRLNELLKAGNIPEAKSLLEPQIQEILSEKWRDFKNVENDRQIRKKSDEFCAKWRTNIQKLSKLDEALEMKRTGRIREEIGKAGIELVETSIQTLENFLQRRITDLKAQFVQTTLNEMNSEMRGTLAKIELQTISDQEWLNTEVDSRMKVFKENCFRHEICNDEWEKIKPDAMKILMTTASTALVIIKMKIEAKEKEMALQREIDAKKDQIEKEKRQKWQKLIKAKQEELKNQSNVHQMRQDMQIGKEKLKAEDVMTEMKKWSLRYEEARRKEREDSEKIENSREIVDRNEKTMEKRKIDASFNANLKVQLPPVNNHCAKLEESKASADQPAIDASPDDSGAEKLVKDELKVFEMVVTGTSIEQNRFEAFLKSEMNQTLKNLIHKYKKQQFPEKDLRKFKDLLIRDGQKFVRENFRMEISANEIENPIQRNISFTNEEEKMLKNQCVVGWMRKLDYPSVQHQFAKQQWQDFDKVTNLNRATLRILIENSNSRRAFFHQALWKNDYNRQLMSVLNRSLAEGWMMFFEKVPRNDLCFEEMQDFVYIVAQRLSIPVAPSLWQYLNQNFPRSVPHHENSSLQHSFEHQGQNPTQHQPQQFSLV